MKEFTQLQFHPDQCRAELLAFKNLLDGKKELDETADVKPFFETHVQLAAFVGSYALNITRFDRIAFQYQLFGDFSCDLVVGDSVRKTYLFVEWEDATVNSLFRQQGQKATPEWATRLEHGFSQIVDWFCKLDDMARTDEFETRFGARQVPYFGLLVVGRDEWLAHPREQRRWQWRSQKVLVNHLPVQCVTYDQLHGFLADKLNAFYPLTSQAIAQGPPPAAATAPKPADS